MRLIRVKVSNYRNIDGITVIFNSNSNYIIGENNIGKAISYRYLERFSVAKEDLKKASELLRKIVS